MSVAGRVVGSLGAAHLVEPGPRGNTVTLAIEPGDPHHCYGRDVVMEGLLIQPKPRHNDKYELQVIRAWQANFNLDRPTLPSATASTEMQETTTSDMKTEWVADEDSKGCELGAFVSTTPRATVHDLFCKTSSFLNHRVRVAGSMLIAYDLRAVVDHGSGLSIAASWDQTMPMHLCRRGEVVLEGQFEEEMRRGKLVPVLRVSGVLNATRAQELGVQ